MRVLVDTSVLVRLRERDNPVRLVCEQSIRQLRYQQHEICVCTQVLIEFWSVATHPVEMNLSDLQRKNFRWLYGGCAPRIAPNPLHLLLGNGALEATEPRHLETVLVRQTGNLFHLLHADVRP